MVRRDAASPREGIKPERRLANTAEERIVCSAMACAGVFLHERAFFSSYLACKTRSLVTQRCSYYFFSSFGCVPFVDFASVTAGRLSERYFIYLYTHASNMYYMFVVPQFKNKNTKNLPFHHFRVEARKTCMKVHKK